MRCADVEVQLDSLRTGEVSQRERKELENHFGGCENCRDTRQQIDSFAGSAKGLLAECSSPTLESVEKRLFDRYDHFEIGAGEVHVAFSEDGVRAIRLGGSKADFVSGYEKRFGRDLHGSGLDQKIREEIRRAIEKGGVPEVAIDLSQVTEFEKKILEILIAIEPGEVRSYAWVAREAGNRAASRAVGGVCARNPIPFVVPCHRVVPTGGGVGSYGYGSAMKRSLLDSEGVSVDLIEEMKTRGFRYIGSKADRSYCFPGCKWVRKIEGSDQVPIRDDAAADSRGFRPCTWCRPWACSA